MTTTDFIADIIEKLMRKSVQRNDDEIKNLFSKQEALTGSSSYLVSGRLYTSLPVASLAHARKVPAHPSIFAEAFDAHTEKLAIERDELILKQGLKTLLVPCVNYQDLRDALPNTVMQFLPVIADFPRTRPEAYTLIDMPMKLHSYESTTLRVIDHYLASRMLF